MVPAAAGQQYDDVKKQSGMLTQKGSFTGFFFSNVQSILYMEWPIGPWMCS
jgi:hypothetical protein